MIFIEKVINFLFIINVALLFSFQPSAARSKTVILVKHLPADTTADELQRLFEKYGTIGRIVLPPGGLTAILEYVDQTEARTGFRALAYTKVMKNCLARIKSWLLLSVQFWSIRLLRYFHHTICARILGIFLLLYITNVINMIESCLRITNSSAIDLICMLLVQFKHLPLYLEWAPVDVFTKPLSADVTVESDTPATDNANEVIFVLFLWLVVIIFDTLLQDP